MKLPTKRKLLFWNFAI